MFVMVVSVRIKPDQRQRFLEAIEDDSICSVRDEPGCMRFGVLQDEADQNHYFFIEVYRDKAALEAHRQTPHYARWMAARGEVVESAEASPTNSVFPSDPSHWSKG